MVRFLQFLYTFEMKLPNLQFIWKEQAEFDTFQQKSDWSAIYWRNGQTDDIPMRTLYPNIIF